VARRRLSDRVDFLRVIMIGLVIVLPAAAVAAAAAAPRRSCLHSGNYFETAG